MLSDIIDRLSNAKDPNTERVVFREDELIAIARDLALALKKLLEFGFVHCDVKPDNVIVTRLEG